MSATSAGPYSLYFFTAVLRVGRSAGWDHTIRVLCPNVGGMPAGSRTRCISDHFLTRPEVPCSHLNISIYIYMYVYIYIYVSICKPRGQLVRACVITNEKCKARCFSVAVALLFSELRSRSPWAAPKPNQFLRFSWFF